MLTISDLFDSSYYLAKNPDVAAAGLDALTHYNSFGKDEGRDPSALFDTSFYLDQNSDVNTAGVNPLTHFIDNGQTEQRDPSAFFDYSWYLAQYADVAAAGIDALQHYLNNGAAEGRDPDKVFDSSYYNAQNPDVVTAGINPLVHFVTNGILEERDPNSSIDLSALRTSNVSFQNAFTASDVSQLISLINTEGGDAIPSTSTPTVTNDDTFDLTTGADNFSGGAGNDLFRATSSTFTSNDTLVGGGGTDTLQITGGGTFNLNSPNTFSGFERVTVADTTITNVTLDNDAPTHVTTGAGAETITLALNSKTWQGGDTVDGGAGSDTLALTGGGTLNFSSTGSVTNIEVITLDTNATTLTTDNDGFSITFGNADHSATGGTGADTFTIAQAQLDGNDTVAGGTGSDTLAITGNAAITAAELGAKTGIDIITLDTNSTSLVIPDAMVGAADATADELRLNNGTFTLGSLDTTAVTSGSNIVAIGGTGQVTLAAGGNNVKVSDGVNAVIVDGSGADTIAGGTGNETITLSGNGNNTVTTGNGTNAVTAGTGQDGITGGTGADTITFAQANLAATDTVAGGTGSDTLAITGNAAITAAELANFTQIDIITLDTNSTSIVIPDAMVGSADATADRLTINNGTFTLATLDTSAVTTGNNIVHIGGTGAVTTANASQVVISDGVNGSIVGGAGADTITGGTGTDNLDGNDGADVISGGTGGDTIDLGTGNDADTWTIAEADIAATGTQTVGTADTLVNWSETTATSDFVNLGIWSLVAGDASTKNTVAASTDDFSSTANDAQAINLDGAGIDFTAGNPAEGFIFYDTAAGQANFDNQAAVDAYITAVLGQTHTVAVNMDVLIVVEDSSNADVIILNYKEGALDADIQTGELTLVAWSQAAGGLANFVDADYV